MKDWKARPTFSQLELRLIEVIKDLEGGGEAAAKDGAGTDAEHASTAMNGNLLGLSLWRTLECNPFEINKGDKIGGVGFVCWGECLALIRFTHALLCVSPTLHLHPLCCAPFPPRISQGATADVFKGIFKGSRVAVKLYRELNAEQAQKEIELVFELRHPNIVGILGFFQVPQSTRVGIVFELCELGDLHSAYKKDWFTDDDGIRILWGCSRALAVRERGREREREREREDDDDDDEQTLCSHRLNLPPPPTLPRLPTQKYMHSFPVPIVHRDLKSTNILVTSDKTGKVADCGESRRVTFESTMTQVGTPLWAAPEVLLGNRYDE